MYAKDDKINTSFKNEKVVKYKLIESEVAKFNMGATFLEIGCGGGTIIRTLANHFPTKRFKGFDTDVEAIDYAKNNDMGNINFNSDLSFSGLFDMIYMVDVFEHCDNPDEMLATVNKRLVKNGKVLIHVPLEKSGIYFIKKCRDIKSLNSDHIVFYNYEDIENIMSRNGFQIADRYFHYHFISGLKDFLKYWMFSNEPNISRDIIYTQNWHESKTTKLVFSVLDWLAYYETRCLSKIKFWSSGVTIIAVRIS